MKRFTPEQIGRKAELVAMLKEAKATAYGAIEKFNATVKQQYADEVLPEIAAFNEVVGLAAEFLSGVHTAASDHFEQQDEDWQDSESGEAYMQWMEAIEAIDDGTAVEIDEPEEIEDFGEEMQEVIESFSRVPTACQNP